MATESDSVYELSADGKKIMTLVIDDQASGLDLMACFNVLKTAFDSATWQYPHTMEVFEEEDAMTGKSIKVARSSGPRSSS
jgi:hypothetical protein